MCPWAGITKGLGLRSLGGGGRVLIRDGSQGDHICTDVGTVAQIPPIKTFGAVGIAAIRNLWKKPDPDAPVSTSGFTFCLRFRRNIFGSL